MRLLMLFTVTCSILLISCSSDIEFNQKEISHIISEIEHSVNADSLEAYQEHSALLTFFNFNSVLCSIGKRESRKDVFSIKPFNFKAKGKHVNVDVFLNYTMDVKFDVADFKVDIPPETMQKIISAGLPNKATFKFAENNGKYSLMSIKYPIRYKYMEILQKYL